MTVATAGLSPGTYSLEVNHVTDGGISKLSRGDLRDPLAGSATFSIACVAVDLDCDGDIDLADFQDLASCLAGPSPTVEAPCIRYDSDGDMDVDLLDAQRHMLRFTGARH